MMADHICNSFPRVIIVESIEVGVKLYQSDLTFLLLLFSSSIYSQPSSPHLMHPFTNQNSMNQVLKSSW